MAFPSQNRCYKMSIFEHFVPVLTLKKSVLTRILFQVKTSKSSASKNISTHPSLTCICIHWRSHRRLETQFDSNSNPSIPNRLDQQAFSN